MNSYVQEMGKGNIYKKAKGRIKKAKGIENITVAKDEKEKVLVDRETICEQFDNNNYNVKL